MMASPGFSTVLAKDLETATTTSISRTLKSPRAQDLPLPLLLPQVTGSSATLVLPRATTTAMDPVTADGPGQWEVPGMTPTPPADAKHDLT